MDKEWLVNALKDSGAVRFGDFTLASGKKSDYYIDIKFASTRPDILREVAKAIAQYSKGYSRIAGVELGAIPVAVAVSLETGLPFIMVRKESKDHGTRRPYEGRMDTNDRVLFVEDVVTTGMTLIKAVKSLRSYGATIDRVVCVVDRGGGGVENLRDEGVELVPLISSSDLFDRR